MAPEVVDVLDKVTDAVRGMYYFDGLWTVHQSALSNLEYMDSHMCGPYRQSKRMAGMMGLAWPLDMYAPSRAEEIRADPRTRLAFNQVPITPKLKAEAMVQKDEAVRLMGESVALWRSLEGKMDAGPHRTTLAGLEGHLDDALILRHAMDLYMDWKLGVLTETKIDAGAGGVPGVARDSGPGTVDGGAEGQRRGRIQSSLTEDVGRAAAPRPA